MANITAIGFTYIGKVHLAVKRRDQTPPYTWTEALSSVPVWLEPPSSPDAELSVRCGPSLSADGRADAKSRA